MPLAHLRPFVRSFSFDDERARVAGGSAILLAPASAERDAPYGSDTPDELAFSEAEVAAFLAGDALTLSWITEAPERHDRERAYVCCWITIESE